MMMMMAAAVMMTMMTDDDDNETKTTKILQWKARCVRLQERVWEWKLGEEEVWRGIG
jgi:hypothetical protein